MNIIKPENALKFILGGKARFVLWNKNTGNRFEYGVYTSKMGKHILTVYSGKYLGVIVKVQDSIEFKGARDVGNITAYLAITWFLRKLVYAPTTIPENVVMYHLGHCCVCGRELKDPVSVELGIGPICRG